jgi:hypothetical protein
VKLADSLALSFAMFSKIRESNSEGRDSIVVDMTSGKKEIATRMLPDE